MSKPTNSAARNQMTPFQREIYDWGWKDAEQRIIKLIEEMPEDHWTRLSGFSNKLDRQEAIALIKGEENE